MGGECDGGVDYGWDDVLFQSVLAQLTANTGLLEATERYLRVQLVDAVHLSGRTLISI